MTPPPSPEPFLGLVLGFFGGEFFDGSRGGLVPDEQLGEVSVVLDGETLFGVEDFAPGVGG